MRSQCLLVICLTFGSLVPTAKPVKAASDLLARGTASGVVRPTGSVGPGLAVPLRAPGGPFLVDSRGGAVFLHGVNVVFKHPPYLAYPDPGMAWNFDYHDASQLASLGFDVVRLGIQWAGLEPGNAPANDPALCSKGPPGDPGQFDQQAINSYLAKVAETVDLLGRYHIYTILDMHQDLYSAVFGGEGAPAWAVCTDGLPVTRPPGRWSRTYGTPALRAAFQNFWTNDVTGNPQGEFDRIWSAVAARFARNPWVLGYDPFNEPFVPQIVRGEDGSFSSELRCFYEGRQLAEQSVGGQTAISCPPGDPALGVIPAIETADPRHLVFYEPDIFSFKGIQDEIGPMDLPRLVLSFHAYCGARSPVTGNPTDLGSCVGQISRTIARRQEDRAELASRYQPGGPAWLMGEFGASSDSAMLWQVTSEADARLLGWIYWSWKFYDDPTGSTDEALALPDGRLRPTRAVLSQAYPLAVAGTPKTMSFDPTSGEFHLTYSVTRRIDAPTVVFMPVSSHYRRGYCALVTGGSVVSRPGARYLEVADRPGARKVAIEVSSGPCEA